MRAEKKFITDEIKSQVDSSPYLIVNDLRSRLRTAGSQVRVVKNTFLARVLKDAGLPELDGALKGQTAIVFGDKDISAAAKLLKNFAAEFKLPSIKAGILDRSVLDSKQVLALADLPSREVLLGKILGLLQAPAGQLVRILNTPASQLAQVLKANAEKAQ